MDRLVLVKLLIQFKNLIFEH